MSDPRIEFAKHLRSIQFALVTTSLALLATLGLAKPELDAASARNELRELIAIVEALTSLRREPAAFEPLRTWALDQASYESCVELDSGTVSGRMLLQTVFTGEEELLWGGLPWRTSSDVYVGNTLSAVQQSWDRFYTSPLWPNLADGIYLERLVSIPDPERYEEPELVPVSDGPGDSYECTQSVVYFETYQSSTLSATEVDDADCEALPPCVLEATVPEDYGDASYGGYMDFPAPFFWLATVYSPHWPGAALIRVPAGGGGRNSGKFLELLLQAVERRGVAVNVEARAKPFAAAFPTLDEVSRQGQLLEYQLNQVGGQLLQLERGSQGSQLTLFGVGFPLEALNLWGLLVLVGVQAYFLLHLRGAAEHLPASFPWIALYRERWRTIEIMLVVTVCGLPCVAAIRLSWETTSLVSSDGWEIARVFGLTGASVYFAIATITELWRLRRDRATGGA